jgi:nucleoside-diphosphate-sugar epimerase
VRTLVVGCGYLGRRIGRLLAERGETVFGLVRTARSADMLAASGIKAVRADVTVPETLDDLPAADRAFYCVGFDRSAGLPMRTVYVDGLSAILSRLRGFAGRFVYASSTGVYGQDDGSWVDERSATEPATATGRVCLEAERRLISVRPDAVILRYSGLYGPDRILRRASLERGEPIAGDPDHWLNVLHVEDAARFAVAALDHPGPGPLYVASDDRPLPRRLFYERVAGCLGLPSPRFLPVDQAAPPRGRDASSKRVRNARIKAELGLACLHPDIVTGIPAALREEQAPPVAPQSIGAGSM